MIENEITRRLSGLVEGVSPAGRKPLAREIGKALAASQRARISAQRNPDGSAYEPRKPQLRSKKGRLRRTMFAKLRTARFLKSKASAESVEIAFSGSASRIAQVHQFGLRDRVNKRGLTAKYPARELLGFTREDEALVENAVFDHLARA